MVITKLKKDMAILEQKVRFLNMGSNFLLRSKDTSISRTHYGNLCLKTLHRSSNNGLQVVQLTRLRRSSTLKEELDPSKRLPFMSDNVIYDMDSTTSPSSSSDSDCSPGSRSQSPAAKPAETETVSALYASGRNQGMEMEEPSSFPVKRVDMPTYSRPATPLREISMNQKPGKSPSTMPRQLQSGSGDSRRGRAAKQTHGASRTVAPRRRWS